MVQDGASVIIDADAGAVEQPHLSVVLRTPAACFIPSDRVPVADEGREVLILCRQMTRNAWSAWMRRTDTARLTTTDVTWRPRARRQDSTRRVIRVSASIWMAQDLTSWVIGGAVFAIAAISHLPI
jgi:hypothetical protein